MQLFWYHLKEQFMDGRERWNLWLPVFFAMGIGLYFLLPSEPSKWLTLGIIETLIMLAVFWRYNLPRLYALLVPVFVVLGIALIQVRTVYLDGLQADVPVEKLYLRGRIVKMDYNSRGNPRLILDDLYDFEEKPVPGRFRVSLRPQRENLRSGQCVELIARLMPLAKASLPGGYQFDRKSFYLGLSGSGYSASRAIPVECRTPESLSRRIAYRIDEIRGSIIRHIREVLPPDQASVAAAIVAGEQGGIRQSLINNYRDSGLAHFLSISGLHMSMIAGMMFFFIRLLIALFPPLALRVDSKKVSALFAIFISVVYLMISGAAIPAQRAFIMTFIVLLGVLFNRRAISMQTIAWAAFLVLLITPEALIGASFQMSFAAVLALIAFYEKFAGSLHRFLCGEHGQNSLPLRAFRLIFAYIAGILVSDLVASLATLPFAVYHFNRVALFTTLANLLAGPVIGLLIMPFTLLSLLLMPFGWDTWSLKIVGFGIAQVNEITAYVSSLPSAGLQVLSMPLWGLLLIVFGGLWLAIWQTAWRRWGIVLILAGFLSITMIHRPDVLINEHADLFAVRDNENHMVIIPRRGYNFIKKIWLDKTASPQPGPERRKLLAQIKDGRQDGGSWLNLRCDSLACTYQNRVKLYKNGGIEVDGHPLHVSQSFGAALYLDEPSPRVVTVRDYIGRRPWNH